MLACRKRFNDDMDNALVVDECTVEIIVRERIIAMSGWATELLYINREQRFVIFIFRCQNLGGGSLELHNRKFTKFS